MYSLARCKFYIYDHNNLLQREKLKKRKNQKIIYMSHGTAFKDGKSEDRSAELYFDKVVTLGKMSTNIICHFWDCSQKKAIEFGEAREDYYCSDLSFEKKQLNRIYGLSNFSKCLLWMPTFRQSYNKRISEDYMINETGLPIIDTNEELNDFNNFLKSKNICVLLKVHHLQADLPIFLKKFSNIKIIKDEEILKNNLKLYKIIPLTDALITDYSSISIDYLPLDKPIIYTLDDFENYKKFRGIYPSNAVDYMPGEHVLHLDQLKKAIGNVLNGNDIFHEERKKILKLFYKYRVGSTSKRILNYLNIKL